MASTNRMPNPYKITTNQELLDALHPVPEFENRDDIKPWLHEKLDARGIQLVIERSDASKVVFKCKNLHRKTSTPRSAPTKQVNGKTVNKRIRTLPEESCPFRLRVSFSVKNKTWAVNIIKDEHNMSLCSNFGDYCGLLSASSTPNTSTPTSTTSHKRTWAYTPASTTSPVMSMINSPASTFTPASEHMDFDFEMRGNKRTRLSYESPLSHEIDPLDPLGNLNIAIPEDITDLNHLSMTNVNNDLQLTQPLSLMESSLDYTDFNFVTQTDDVLSAHLATTDKMFDLTMPSSNSNEDLYSKLNTMSNTSSMNTVNAFKPSSQLNVIGQTILEEEEDPLMYLLSSSNSRYTIEELESLDKAMGVDDNDQFLMSMFNKM